MSRTLKERPRESLGVVPAISSYSAASNSRKWRGWKNLGRRYCLMLMRRKNGKGNKIPAIGIHVTPKHTRKYTSWKSVNIAMDLNGTNSTNEAWTPSNTLPKVLHRQYGKLNLYELIFNTICHVDRLASSSAFTLKQWISFLKCFESVIEMFS